jgi:hypothetical protein
MVAAEMVVLVAPMMVMPMMVVIVVPMMVVLMAPMPLAARITAVLFAHALLLSQRIVGAYSTTTSVVFDSGEVKKRGVER